MAGKKVKSWPYVSAIIICKGEWIAVDPCDIIEESAIAVSGRQLSAEKQLIKQQAYDRLSTEAKEVIDLILNAPSEVIEYISTPKRKMITKRRIKFYLREMWHSHFITNLVLEEIEAWVNQL